MSLPKTGKMLKFINWRVKVVIQDTRWLVGTLMAYDKHMNIVLSETEEFRLIPGKGKEEDKELRRMLGFMLLRGDNVISIVPIAPPPPKPKTPGDALGRGGPGISQPSGRGMPPMGMQPGLGAPMPGIGGAGMPHMMPQGRGMPGYPPMGGMLPPMPPQGFPQPPAFGGMPRGFPQPPQQ